MPHTRPPLPSRWWTWLPLTLAAAFTVWTVWLILAARAQMAEVEEGVGLVSRLSAFQVEVEDLGSGLGLAHQSGPPDGVEGWWEERLSACARRAREIEEVAGAERVRTPVAEATTEIARADTAMRRLLEPRHAATHEEDEGKFLDARRRAGEAVRGAIAAERRRLAELSRALAAKWHQLTALVFIACFVAAGTAVLLGRHRRASAAWRRAEEDLERSAERLRQAEKAEAVARLAGGVAHDFNNLLTVILGVGARLRGALAAPAARQDLDDVLAAAQRGAALTRQLVAISRRQAVQPSLLDLNVVVRDMEGILRRTVGDDVDLMLQLEPEPVRVRGDRSQLDQVLLNLAVNARDAMPYGGRLTVATRLLPPGREGEVPAGARAALVVRDTGTGMTAEVKARIFERFFTTKEPGRGTGIGLATVLGIVEQCGGRIAVDSRPGEGAEFTILLPLAGTSAPPAVAPAPPPAARTILLVDDNDVVREFARSVLSGAGYRVLEAGDGRAALERLAAHPGPIHLLLTDVSMPGADGHELAAAVRRLRPEVPVATMTGAGTAAAAGHPAAMLQKPFTAAALLELVARQVA